MAEEDHVLVVVGELFEGVGEEDGLFLVRDLFARRGAGGGERAVQDAGCFVELAVQVNGKVRGKVTVATEAAKEAVLEAARASVDKQLEGKEIVKSVVVPGKLVNFVVR